MTTTDEIHQDFLPYLLSNGLVGPQAGQGSNNGLLYLSEYIVCLDQNGALSSEDVINCARAMVMCQPTFLGCFSRSPDGSGGQEGPDDYTGVAAASPAFASFIVDYGRQHFWVYNNTNPGSLRTQAGDINWASFFIRFPGLIAHLHYGANIMPNWWLRQAWRLTVLWSALTASGQDDWILTWLLVVTAGEKSTLNRWCKRLWLHRLLKAYPGGINEVFKNYFGFQHPIAKWAKNE